MKRLLTALIAVCSLITLWAQQPATNAPALAPNVIEKIEFQGLKNVSPDTAKAAVRSKAGEVYDEQAVRRDFTSLWNTGRFDDLRLKTGKGERGGVVVSFVVTERP
jgi:outer membrane protein insertion porin family